jgi:23S rRNA (pseudouridine1915-N3)-methyltransferase
VKLHVVAVGKIREKSLRAVADDYLARVRHYARTAEIEVRTDAELFRAVPREATVVALDPGGDALTSRELAQRLERWGQRGKGELAFVLGGAEGIPEPLLESAHARLSLSSLTLPHRLARVVLLEQLYRAFTIIRGEPYARED